MRECGRQSQAEATVTEAAVTKQTKPGRALEIALGSDYVPKSEFRYHDHTSLHPPLKVAKFIALSGLVYRRHPAIYRDFESNEDLVA